MNSDPRPMRQLRLAIGCGALAMLAACRDTPEEVVAEHRPAVEAVFAQVAALEPAVRAAPPLVDDRIDIGSPPPKLDGEGSNALYLRAEHLRSPAGETSQPGAGTMSMRSMHCAQVLGGAATFPADSLRHMLPTCARTQYVFVQRTTTDVPARLLDSETFQPGLYAGEVLLFRLADGALLGGFRVSAESSTSIMVTADESGRATDPVGGVNHDLRAAVTRDIEAALERHVPGVLGRLAVPP